MFTITMHNKTMPEHTPVTFYADGTEEARGIIAAFAYGSGFTVGDWLNYLIEESKEAGSFARYSNPHFVFEVTIRNEN